MIISRFIVVGQMTIPKGLLRITYHLGDVSIAMKAEQVRDILTTIRGKKILVRGNHDSGWSDTKWMNAGFDFVCDSIGVGDILLTHEPTFISGNLYRYNVHGHLHNIGYQGVKAFGGTYEYFNDGKHFLYSPELQMYTPKRLDKFMNW
jgi:calcineurin-like phosphoesterase family protein